MATIHPIETNSGIVTSWLPLTTGVPNVPACSSAIYSQQGTAGQLIAYDPFYVFVDPAFTTECLPPQFTQWWNQVGGSPTTSLGPLVCPDAYTTALTIDQGPSSTQLACCPSGYTFDIDEYLTIGECKSFLQTDEVLTYLTATDTAGKSWFQTSASISSGVHVVGLQINGWIFGNSSSSATTSSSSSSSPSTTASPGSIASGSSATTTGASSSSTASTTNSPSSAAAAGLTSGAKAGIGVGVALGVIAIGALIAGIFLLRRRRNMEGNELEQNNSPLVELADRKDPAVAELHDGVGPPELYPEGHPQQFYELGGDERMSPGTSKKSPVSARWS